MSYSLSSTLGRGPKFKLSEEYNYQHETIVYESKLSNVSNPEMVYHICHQLINACWLPGQPLAPIDKTTLNGYKEQVVFLLTKGSSLNRKSRGKMKPKESKKNVNHEPLASKKNVNPEINLGAMDSPSFSSDNPHQSLENLNYQNLLSQVKMVPEVVEPEIFQICNYLELPTPKISKCSPGSMTRFSTQEQMLITIQQQNEKIKVLESFQSRLLKMASLILNEKDMKIRDEFI